ncbi:hypothetical protein CROQUDRAFT_103668 [Cronartium quercuum f. sp. fusiforme G11]|uniref:Uncharacterized protein n=1 Tax=Cronartium quercuum f. sp. fusiforme G11 TaxID=708437 RepID=A0A9P6NQ96_9BASI|nr:hypothetical protein CROQUDRAFT_103668 [Cronartium quercuum f. sp. fusiforme G11]
MPLVSRKNTINQEPSPSQSLHSIEHSTNSLNTQNQINLTHSHHHNTGISSIPSLFFRSHHTLLNATSLTNLRASANNTPEPSANHLNQSSRLLTTIKRSNSFGESIHSTRQTHYITHSSKQDQNQILDHTSITKSIVSSFSRSDFFKRTHTPTTTSLQPHPNSNEIEIIPDSSSSVLNSFKSNSNCLIDTTPTTTLTTINPTHRIIHSNKGRPTNAHLTTTALSIKPEPISNIKRHPSKKNDSISSINLNTLGIIFNNNNSNSNTNNTNSNLNMNSANKPVIRHITSNSTLSSNINININNPSNNAFGSKSDPKFGAFLNGGNGNGDGHVGGLALKPGDIWSQIVMRVIPLFNGEGHKGFIEDLNDFVSQHINKTISDSPSKSINKLTSELNELLKSGVLTLNHKFAPETLSDSRLLVRLIEVWHFFYTGVLPYLEAIFLPLMINEKLVSVIESKNNKLLKERLQQIHLLKQVSSTSGLPPSSTQLLFKSSSIKPKIDDNLSSDSTIGIEVRKLALLSFREFVILPLFNRLYNLFGKLYDTSYKSVNDNHQPKLAETIKLDDDILHFKRLQMLGLLSTIGCNDRPGLNEVESLSRLIRLKKVEKDLIQIIDYKEPTGKLNKEGSEEEENNQSSLRNKNNNNNQRNKNRDFARRSIRRQLGRYQNSEKNPSPEILRTPNDSTSNHKLHKNVGFLEFSKEDQPPDLKPILLSKNNFNQQQQNPSSIDSNKNSVNVGSLRHAVHLKIKSLNYFGTNQNHSNGNWIGDDDVNFHSPI